MQIHIYSQGTPRGWRAKSLALKILKILQKENHLKKIQRAELNLSFVNGPQMQRLNKKFRGKNVPTDVLSFESQNPYSLGDLVLCVPVLKAQAKEWKHTLHSELALLLVHGILHLLGHDHEGTGVTARKNAKRMQTLEHKVLSQVSSGAIPVFDGLISRSKLMK